MLDLESTLSREALANLIAGVLVWRIGKVEWRIRGRNASWLLAVIVETIVVGVIVGSYLSWIFGVPILLQIGLILAGSIVSINILGYLLLRALGRPRIRETFQSHGLVPED